MVELVLFFGFCFVFFALGVVLIIKAVKDEY